MKKGHDGYLTVGFGKFNKGQPDRPVPIALLELYDRKEDVDGDNKQRLLLIRCVSNGKVNCANFLCRIKLRL